MSCAVLLSKGAFFPGELLQGTLQINAGDHGVRAEVIHVKVKGEEKTKWVEQKSRQVEENGRMRTEHYEEVFEDWTEVLCVKMDLLLPPPGSRHIHLPPGIHNFPFAVQLPAQLPSSFHLDDAQGKAHVHYIVKGGGRKSEAKGSLEFAVHSHLPAPSFSQFAVPFTGSKAKTFNLMCLLCCVQTGPLTVSATIGPKCFAAPGERLSLNVQVSNESGKSVGSVTAKLIGTAHLKAHHHHRTVPLVFEPLRLHHGHTQAQQLQLNDITFVIPGDVRLLSTCNTTRLVDVSYALEIEVHMTEVFVVNPRITAPLLISSPCCSASIPMMMPPPPMPTTTVFAAPVLPANTPLLAPAAGGTTGYGAAQ